MITVGLRLPPSRPLSLLCLGAHPDDIEIGCGGTVLRLLRERPGTHCTWVVFTGNDRRRKEARAGARSILREAGRLDIILRSFRDGFLPYEPRVKDVFEQLKKRVRPDLVLTHYRCDRHQDHRIISDLTWNTFRDHVILEYEIPKYDGDFGIPNLFVPVDQAIHDEKVSIVERSFASQRSKPWFTRSTLEALGRLRGVECREPFAEAFYARKIVL